MHIPTILSQNIWSPNDRRGKWWSANDGEWVKTHLKSEQEWIDQVPVYDEDLLGDSVVPEEVLQERRRDDDDYQRAREFGVYDTELYDLLGVDPDATMEDIHRRFAQLGKVFNPNRAGANTAAARDKLNQLSTAYAILTNPRLRERYDREGVEALAGGRRVSHCAVNPVQLYATLYGSEQFAPYIGRLAAASEALAGQERSKQLTLVEARQLQKRRVTRLALLLAQRLKLWVNGDRDTAQMQWKTEALELCQTNYGVELVHLVGSAYSLSAAQFLGSFESGIGMPSIRRWAHKQRITVQQSGQQAAQKVAAFAGDTRKASLQNEAIGLVLEDATDDELFHRIGADVLEHLWTRTAVDVTSTIHETSQMVLFDQDLNDDTRKLRGEGLEALGQIFQDAQYEKSPEVAEAQNEYERIAFCAVLETIRNHELATANAPKDVD